MTEKIFLNSYQDKCSFFVLVVNSNSQELVHHIHYFGYILCHQSNRKKGCWFHNTLFFFIFLLDFIHPMSQTYLILNKTFISIMIYWYNNIFSHPLPFYASYCCLLQTNIPLVLTEQISRLQQNRYNRLFYQQVICLNPYSILT